MGPVILGFSGPDGSGKSSAAHATGEALTAAGIPNKVIYVHGCAVCRRWSVLPQFGRRGRWARASSWLGFLHRVHGYVDLADAMLRVWLAARPPWPGRSARTVIVTDRTPLDGLVHHRPQASSLLTRGYLGISRRYQGIQLLDAVPEELERRDGEHAATELAEQRQEFAGWASRLAPRVTPMENARLRLDEIVASTVERTMREMPPTGRPAPVPAPGADPATSFPPAAGSSPG